MIELDLDRLFGDDDDPTLGISIRLSAVERYLDLLTEFVPHIQDQTLTRWKANIQRKSSELTMEDIVDEIEDVKSVIEHLIPSNFYGSFVISLYAAVESSVTEIAGYVQKKESARLSLSDLRESNTLKRLSLFLETLMKETLNAPQDVIESVRQLQLVRNVLAHANGSLKEQRQDRRTDLLRLAESKVGILVENNSVVVTAPYLRYAFSSAESFLRSLLAQVANRYPVK